MNIVSDRGHVPGIGDYDRRTAYPQGNVPTLAGIARIVVRQEPAGPTERWFIVPSSPSDDAEYPPIGPFDTVETALITLRLMS